MSIGSRGSLLAFVDAVLCGVAQVMLQDNRYTGLLFLAGVFYSSRLFGIAVLAGAVVGTGTALVLGAERQQVCRGLFGFNGALVAVALVYFFHADPLFWAYLVLAVIASSVLMAAMTCCLSRFQVPALTAPFVVTALGFLLASASFGRLHPTHLLPAAELPKAAIVEGVVELRTIVEGWCNGLAQVFFQRNVVTGLLFAAGLFVGSRRAFVAATGGSLVGMLVAWAMGAPEQSISAGVFGFNAVLTAIALASFGPHEGWRSVLYTLVAVVVATVVYAAISAALEPVGMPALTLSFVLTTWVFLIGARPFLRLRATSGADQHIGFAPDRRTPGLPRDR